MYDLVIKNGNIIDGIGNNAFKGDIAISGSKIVAIGNNLRQDALQLIDANERIVCPGFIDGHRHADAKVLGKVYGEIELRQGITTVLSGNCGLSMAPCPKDKQEMLYTQLEPIIGRADDSYLFETFGQYIETIQDKRFPFNFGMFIGNGTVRIAVKGWDATPLTDEEIQKIQHYFDDAMEAGAYGVSLGIMYTPEIYYSKDQYSKIFSKLSRYNTLITAHIRGEGNNLVNSISEVIEIAEDAGCNLNISHLKAAGRSVWGTGIVKSLALMEEARKRGTYVTCDFYPYPAGSTLLITLLPPDLLKEGTKAALLKLKERIWRQQITAELKVLNDDWDNILCTVGWGAVMLSSVHSIQNQQYIGWTIEEIARHQQKDEFDCFFDLLIEEEGRATMIYFMISEKDINRILQDDYSAVISDSLYSDNGIPHPRLYGSFPRVIAQKVREEGIISLENAIYKMTGLPAKINGIDGKGILKAGADADINIFDYYKIQDKATFLDPCHMSEGFDYVLVNGRIAVENDRIVNLDCGKLLRKRKIK